MDAAERALDSEPTHPSPWSMVSGAVRPSYWGFPSMGPSSGGGSQFLLPVGTVTFLLADVEGSTGLWEARGPDMGKAVSRLYELASESIGRCGGVRPEEQGEGDSFVAAFARASEALSCALHLQRAISEQPWPDGAALKIRIGLHTGEAQIRDDRNYFGPAVNRAARIRDTAHGGQVVMSRATHDLVVDHVPEGAALRDLGAHRLKDLSRPEHIYQLTHPDLEADFPPLRSIDALPNNLPVQLTTFIGRESEIEEVGRLLSETRLLTLTGSGGVGKTRLAIQVGAEQLEHRPDGVWFVDLAPVSEEPMVAKALTSALGLTEGADLSLTDTLTRYLGAKDLLVVLDNCEHLIAAAARLADEILRACPSVIFLATSRQPLAVPGEITHRVPSLSLPQAAVPIQELKSLTESEAVRLFIDRAVRARQNFRVTNENAPAVAGVCERLDGIPLAIELAAARVRALTPEQIADGLTQRFLRLGTGARTVMPRHQTLRASVDWSYGLIGENERAVLRRLSVFAGGFSLDAAEAVCSESGVERHEILDVLSELVDKSLVSAEEQGSATRYRLLETVRAYGLERLAEAQELQYARSRHFEFYLAFAERAEPELTRSKQEMWFSLLEAEHDNLRLALEFAGGLEEPDPEMKLVASLILFWLRRNHFREGRRWLEHAAARLGTTPALRAKVMWGIGIVVGSYLHETELGARAGEEAIQIARETHDEVMNARATANLAFVRMMQDRLDEAEGLARAAIAMGHEAHDDCAISESFQTLAYALEAKGDLPAAAAAYRQSVDAARVAGDDFALREAALWLGRVAVFQGSFNEAIPLLEPQVAWMRGRHGADLGTGLAALASAHLGRGDLSRADSIAHEALEAGRTWGRPQDEAVATAVLADIALARGEFAEAEELSRQALAKPSVSANRLLPQLLTQVRAELALGSLDQVRDHALRALELARDRGMARHEARARLYLAALEHPLGDAQQAEDLAHRALAGLAKAGDHVGIVEALELIASVAAGLESVLEATRLRASADSLRTHVGFARPPADQESDRSAVAFLQESMGKEAFEAAWAEGTAMTVEEAVGYASRGRGERKRPSAGWASLTPTELAVVKLVAQGLSNPQIGERLFISRRTVQTHLTHVFGKLGTSSRSELAVAATKRGITD